MSKNAVLRFTPLEQAYQKAYHIMPDYHFERLAKEQGFEKAGQIVQANMDKVWQESKALHAKQERDEQLQLERECPFSNRLEKQA